MLLYRDRAAPCDGGVFLRQDRATPWYYCREGSGDTVSAETPRDAVEQRSRDTFSEARPCDAVVTARSHDTAAAARRLAFRVYQVQGHNSRKVKVVDEPQGHEIEGQGHTPKSRS